MAKKNRDSSNSLSLYFQSVGKAPLLSLEEEKELIVKAQDGDKAAFEKIIIANQRLVVKEVLKYYFKGDNFLDLINEGNKGLIEALRRFDLSRQNRFYTYALWWVRSEIRRYLPKNQLLISLPDMFFNNYLNYKKAYFKLSKKLKRRPTEKELSRETNLPVKQIKLMLQVPEEIISLDKTVIEGSNTNLSTLLPDSTNTDPQNALFGLATRDIVREDVEELTTKESDVIKMRFGFGDFDPMKLREIARKLDMSPEGIRRIEIKALGKLRKKLLKQGVYGVLN
jgi:RNA polymerase primary sigma factor